MSKELVIAANRHETKVAILEDDQLVEVIFQRAHEYSLAGSIHKGRVTRVLPGMQSAFVDVGLERDTFLYVSDFFEENEDLDRVATTREEPRRDRESRPTVTARPPREESAPPAGGVPDPEAEGEIVTAGPIAPSGAEPRSDQDRGDRQGQRRSRRRRNRGRGFPDSKYAPAESRYGSPESRTSPEQSRAPRSEETPSPVVPVDPSGMVEFAPAPPQRSPEFSVLPGESLAKYSRSNIQPLDDAEEEEIRNLQETHVVLDAEDAPLAAEPEPEPESAAWQEPEPQEPPAELHVTLDEEDLFPAELEPEPAAEPEAEVAAEPVAHIPQPPPLPDEVAAQAEIAEERSAIEAEGESLPHYFPEVTADAGAETEGPSETEEDGAPAADAQPGAETPQTAQVREQGGRYMHRAPRRMRRKTRGAAHNEGRTEQRTDGAPALAPAVDVPVSRPEPRSGGRPEKPPLPSITELLKEGQEIIVQIAKEPLGQKGARITSHIALPGRYVVYMPTLEHTGVSRKIASDDERLRLKKILQIHHAGMSGGFIVRTAGEGQSEEDLAADMNFLYNLWIDIRQKAEKKPAPLLLHHDLDIVQRTLRDQFTEQFKAIWVDNEELYESVLRFVQRFQPSLVTRVKLYTRPEPIFDAFNITAELEKALRPKVWLKSGGYIVINQTEALVAIDVNTGKYVGRSNRLEDTIVKTNTEAVNEIVRQIRLRDLGGIIVVDFIDMDERKNRQKVMQVLEEAMRADKAPYKILQFNDFGLVAITRKRVKQSLERALCMPCPHCEGAGYIKSVQTVVGEILQEAHKMSSVVDGKDCVLRVHPDIAKLFKSNQNKYLEEMEEILRRPVLVRADSSLHHEKFDLA